MTAADRRRSPAADVVVVGDGPAGLALAAACAATGVDTLVVGNAREWTATYATWVDDVGDHAESLAARTPVDVVAVERRRLRREYGVFDNALLRAALSGAPHLVADVAGVEHDERSSTVLTTNGERVHARLVVDASGPRPALVDASHGRRGGGIVQSAYGLVLDERPAVVEGDAGVLMDWRPAPDGELGADATFLYVVPVGGGRWLVEETSLARRTPLAEVELRRRLAARMGIDHSANARHVERVLIPMTRGVPRRSQRVVGFGAAGGYVHPATGYSVAASLRAAPRVAGAIAAALGRTDDPRELAVATWNAVWPAEHRRARALHDYGSAAILRMSPAEVRTFFDAFFALPEDQWAEYLRVDTAATDVVRVMRSVFSSVPWALRRRLALGSPVALGGLLR